MQHKNRILLILLMAALCIIGAILLFAPRHLSVQGYDKESSAYDSYVLKVDVSWKHYLYWNSPVKAQIHLGDAVCKKSAACFSHVINMDGGGVVYSNAADNEYYFSGMYYNPQKNQYSPVVIVVNQDSLYVHLGEIGEFDLTVR